ncbi:hypothetical protein H8A97_34990 [Bradyrhizobium sp. Arg62]|nr:hypothetical protein [Bradyrhizobium ivorense]MCC8950152.1 hypothetical protein [Bradyrhizobium brasilense]
MRWYAEQQELQRARQEADVEPSDQDGFEQHLGELQLLSPEESSSDEESSSEASFPAQSHGNIRRTDIGGSMWLPPRSSLQDSSFDSTRYSVAAPHAHLGSAANDYRSDLRDRTFSSMRYAAPSEAQSTARIKDKKSRGLFSKVKSILSKAFGGSRGESSGSASDAIYSELRMDFAKRSHPPDVDVDLFKSFRAGAAGKYTQSTIANYVSALTQFSNWLGSQDLTLASLLDDPDPSRLAARTEEFLTGDTHGNRNLNTALIVVQEILTGRVSVARTSLLGADVELIDSFRSSAAAKYTQSTIATYVSVLTQFARWLASQNLTLASLLDGPQADRLTDYAAKFLSLDPAHVSSSRLGKALTAVQDTLAGVIRPRRKVREVHPDDAQLIEQFAAAAGGLGVPDKTINNNSIILRGLAAWLNKNNKPPLASRFQDPSKVQSLASDILQYKRDGFDTDDRLDSALSHLRRLAPGKQEFEAAGAGPRVMGRRTLHPYPADAALIDGLLGQRMSDLDPGATKQRQAIHALAANERRFSDWLQRENKGSLASRLKADQEEVTKDLQEFKKVIRRPRIQVTLESLRKHLEVVEANRALGVPFPQQKADSNSTSTWIRDLPTPPPESEWPPVLGPFGQAGLQEPAGSSSTWSPQLPSYFDFPTPMGEPARSLDIYRGLDSFIDRPSTPQEMGDDAQSGPVLSPAGRPPFFIGPSGMPQELEDIGYLVGEDWQHGSQPVPDFLLDVLDNKMLLPSSRMAPQPVFINGETYSITLGPRGRRDAQLIHHPGPSSVPDVPIGHSTASASAGDRSGRVLEAEEWLGDEHIQRDYELQAQELSASNPNLAARTRFVDPLMAFQVGQGTGDVALTALHRIVNDRDGNDTADFLFLPVSDASTTDLDHRGSHWSLLLVDRRDRDRPFAYHYDSAQGYNDRPAAILAERVGADLRNASIRQQTNGYDCGVFVVDGTRALVRRLAGRQADLSLGSLVVDRQALQNRLRG